MNCCEYEKKNSSMIFLKKISGREMLDQAEIALHCVIKFLKTYFASFKKLFNELYPAEHTLSRAFPHSDKFR